MKLAFVFLAVAVLPAPALAQQSTGTGTSTSGELGSMSNPAPICTATVTDSCMQCGQAPKGYPGSAVCRGKKRVRDADDRKKHRHHRRDRD